MEGEKKVFPYRLDGENGSPENLKSRKFTGGFLRRGNSIPVVPSESHTCES
jgi:hypothetical protein